MKKLIKTEWYALFFKYHFRKAYKFRMYEDVRKYHIGYANFYWDKIKGNN